MAGNMNNAHAAMMMQKLSEAAFYVTDLNLYLDTHPDDEKALCMFREACERYKKCKKEFEEHHYPLTVCSSDCDYSWEWLVGAWPSEKLV